METSELTTITSESKITRANFDEIIAYVERHGKMIEPEFEIALDQREYYFNLTAYFDNSKECAWDLSKGLLIVGDIGTGKTLSMNVINKVFSVKKKCLRIFQIVSARHVLRDFLINGAEIIDTYGRKSCQAYSYNSGEEYRGKYKIHELCFDDLGNEENKGKNYGNQLNVMAEILLDRYDNLIAHGERTFATTNFSADNLEQLYGERVRDRMREMFNYITLTGKSKRK